MLFEELFGGDEFLTALRAAARLREEIPQPRVCVSKQDLAAWFVLAGDAAGVIARPRPRPTQRAQ